MFLCFVFILLLPEMQYAVISENKDASKMENSDA